MKRTLPLLFTLTFVLACNAFTPKAEQAPIPTAVSTVEIPYAKIIYYDISGSTQTELRDQMNILAPTGADGYRGDALTNWYIRWTWEGYSTEECDLSTAKATYDIKVTMPRWFPPQEASPALVEKWNAYILALAAHEKVHVDNVIANLPVVINAIRRATCSTAETRAQEILDGIRQNDIEFDAQTEHGAAQGARFP